MVRIFLVLACCAAACAQSPETPTFDTRLSIHTIVREDIFAGFLGNDMERFARGEKKLEHLLVQRPSSRAELLAWQGGAALYRAVREQEAGHAAEFSQQYQRAVDLFKEALRLAPASIGVQAVTGGSYVTLADRLPDQHRAEAWSQAYNSFSSLWKAQSAGVEKLPLHMKGELLAGLAQSAQRTGRNAETAQHLDRMISLLANTPYEARAKRWKENPEVAVRTTLACQTCHEAGTLAARTAALAK